MKPFTTRRLYLRPLITADLDDLYALYGQAAVMQYITGSTRDRAKTAARLAAHIADHQQHGFGLCAAIWRPTGAMIGRCGLEPRGEPAGSEGDIAWMFRPEFWGRGLATEFAQAMIPIGFNELKLKRIFATAHHQNKASIRVMQKLGMALVRQDERGVEYELLCGA